MADVMLKRLLLTVLLLCAGPAWASAPGVLVLGDSLSAAYGIEVEHGWVHLLQRRLQDSGLPHRVINASVSGETTSGGLARLPDALARHRPEVVILALGGNDGLRGLPLSEIRANLERMIELSRASGARVLLGGIRLPPNYGMAYTQRFHAIYHALAEAHQVPLVPFLLEGVAGNGAYMQADGIHPRAEAQPLILDNVWPALRPLLTSAAALAAAAA